jgi:hypothetical protein
MTDPLTQLEAADKARTPGPWRVDGPYWWDDGDDSALITAGEQRTAVVLPAIKTLRREPFGPDLDFIALCGTHVPALLAELRAARALLDAAPPGRKTARHFAVEWLAARAAYRQLREGHGG